MERLGQGGALQLNNAHSAHPVPDSEFAGTGFTAPPLADFLEVEVVEVEAEVGGG